MRYLNYTFSKIGSAIMSASIVTYTYMCFGVNFEKGLKKAEVKQL